MRRSGLVVLLGLLASCAVRRLPVGSDSGFDASSAAVDGGHDAAVVTMVDAAEDAGHDAATVAIDAGHDAGSDGGHDGGHDAAVVVSSAPLLFSEYVEGTGNNKAIEIANVGTSSFTLTGCTITLYANGASTMTATYDLTGSLAAGAVFTLCNSGGTIPAASCTASIAGGVMGYNGNDALALDCTDGSVDVIGQIGGDPGSAGWGTTVTTTNDTIRRLCTVTMGDANGSDAFDPATQWTSAGVDVFDGLGMRGCP